MNFNQANAKQQGSTALISAVLNLCFPRIKLSVIISTILMCMTFPVYADPLSNDIILSVKPKLCVLNNERQTCKDKIIISWKSKKSQSLCLFSERNENSLACWHESWSGETEQLIKTKEPLLFYLKDKEIIVAQEKLEVFKSYAKRNKRSRKRHPWSLF